VGRERRQRRDQHRHESHGRHPGWVVRVDGGRSGELVVTLLGNEAAKTETFVDAEAGYRLEVESGGSIDVTAFVGRYDHLQTNEAAAPIVQFAPSPRILVISQIGDQLQATTRGLEIAGHWTSVPAWRLDGSYTAFHLTPQLAATSEDPAAAREDGSAPRTQWQLRSAFSPVSRTTLDVAIFHAGPLEQLGVDAYTRADINVEWRFTSRLSAMVIGQNLFNTAHAEFGGTVGLLLGSQVPRSVNLRLRWTFR
jgi:iron complex outermembrane recepter protein